MMIEKKFFKWLILPLILVFLVGCIPGPLQPPTAPLPTPPEPTTPTPTPPQPTTPPPPPLPPEIDVFPDTLAEVTLVMPTGQESIIDLSGPTTVHVFFEGEAEGDAQDNDGDALDEVQTEIIEMQLTGMSPLGPMEVHLNPDIPSTGEIEEKNNDNPGLLDLPPFTPEGTADSFFDVFFEIEVGEFVFRTDRPKRMESVIRHKPPEEGDTYFDPELIPLLDLVGQPTGFFIGSAHHTPNPPPPLPPEVDHFPESSAEVILVTPTGQESIVELSGPTTVHVFFEGEGEGDARDHDGDGLDEVQTEIVEMQLTGMSPLGPMEVRLNPDIPSIGEIEENSNNNPGLLDLPPFTPEGTADSFFDVFFEVEVGEFVFRSDGPKRMETTIRHKPPEEGDTYFDPELIPLVDLFGQPTGFFIGSAHHTPNPPPPLPPEVDHFPESLAEVILVMPTGQESIIELSGPTTVHVFFEGEAEGDARDHDGDGLDEVQTEIVEMQLTGMSPLGPMEVRLNPDIPSIGEIEENRNNNPGLLDLPPFSTRGTADSFFDVFFEVELGEFVFRSDRPKRMETTIRHKPPEEGDTYFNPELIPLVDLYGQPTGFFIGSAHHTPNPPPPLPPEPPPSQQTLYAAFAAGAECSSFGEECSCQLSVSFDGNDLTLGDYPVTQVVLRVNGQVWHDSGPISKTTYHGVEQRTVNCGQTFNIEVTVNNSIGQTANAADSLTTWSP